MKPQGLQVLGTYLLLVLVASCEGAPARSKHWRHQPEPRGDQVSSQISSVLDQEKARIAALAERDDTLSVWLDSPPKNLVPLVDPSEWAERITMGTVFETLLDYRVGVGAGDPGGYGARLAAEWKVLDGGRILAIELRRGVLFHNGSKLSSIDVQFSLDAVRSPRTGADHLRRGLSSVSAVELSGPRGIRIYLHKPDATVLRTLAQVPILSAAVHRKGFGSGADVVGTGPYRLAKSEDGSIRLETFADYYGQKPAVSNLVFRYQPDAALALSQLRGGEIDVVLGLIPAHYPAQTQAPGVAGEFEPIRLRPPAFRYLVFNTTREPFDDERVRCAVSALVDRQALAKRSKGLRRPSAGPIWPGGPGDGPAMRAIAFDSVQADRWLEDAGWRRDGDQGIRTKGGKRLLLTVLVSDRQDVERDMVLDQLRAAGFVLDARIGQPAVLDRRLREGEFDIGFVEWRGQAGADLSPLFGSGGSYNFGRFHDLRVDDAFARMRESWQPAERWRWMGELGGYLAQTCAIAPLTAPDPYGLRSRRVGGFEIRGGRIDWAGITLDPSP